MPEADPRADARRAGLPIRDFFYTLDQIGYLVGITEKEVKDRYVHFEGRTPGARKTHLLLARNIAPPDEKPDWRVAEREFIRWLKKKGFKVYDRAWVQA